jgi:hypothetical protein
MSYKKSVQFYLLIIFNKLFIYVIMRMLFLQSMKSLKKTLFQLVFLYAVLFCFGHILHSNVDSHHDSIELTVSSNSVEISNNSHDNSIDDEQINQTMELTSIIETIGQLPVIKYVLPPFIFLFRNWQPPKV